MMLAAYKLALRLVAGPVLNNRVKRDKEDPSRLDERKGIASQPRPDGPLVWFQAASVGESLSVLPVIDALLADDPALHVLVTTGTKTSAALMAERLPDRAIHQFVPLDRADWVARFLDHWQPDLGLFVESEIWPNLILAAQSRNIPLGIVNARLSEGSAKNWQRMHLIRGLARRLFGSFDLVMAQDQKVADSMTALGAKNAIVTGNLKLAADPLPVSDRELDALKQLLGDGPVLVAASTHPGEEDQIADVHADLVHGFPGLCTIIAPRHPERGGEIKDLIGGALRSDGDLPAPGSLYIADTLGELGLFYRLADFVFLGGSLVPHGGQNPLEPAQLGKAILTGPHTHNFPNLMPPMLEAGALIEVTDADDLARHLRALLADDAAKADLQQAALDFSDGQGQPVLDAVLNGIKALRGEAS